MFTFTISILISIIVPLNYDLCSCQCARAEYETDNQCCPMCAPGNRVYWDCTDDTSTTCVPCLELTFTDEPNGLKECFPCTVCDTNRGLRVNKACSRSSDTVCEPLEKFYCIDKMKSSCTSALQHSDCKPGQYIKQAGTGSTDTVCAECTGDTYSNGSFSSCLPHTKCEDTGHAETSPGTHSSDTQCGNPSTPLPVIIPSVIAILILIIAVSGVLAYKHFCTKEQYKRTGRQLIVEVTLTF
ncbi:tumor necrosis factor receptor superfamily member 14-like [Danio aesculapii]|uniref:tumor necrosis factor receptor superfamily member 14-like n=1 Tax=Danio aesculapii TaxID=1142201 RepID=UPI0024C0CE65|nr:tumor necrosis factor receptor superfamily member 14-like [Danio aesculapii]